MLRIFLYYISSLLLVAAIIPDGIQLNELKLEDQAEQSPKINWLPVWQEHEQLESDPNQARSLDNDIAIPEEAQEEQEQPELVENISSQREGDTCGTIENRGIHGLIREARALLPIEHLRNILANAARDPEIQRLRALIRSAQFRAKLSSIRASYEHRILHDFGCRRLHLNYGYYVEYVRIFLNIHLDEKPTSILINRRPGIRGLLQDLRDALPAHRIRALYKRLVATDRELATSVSRIQSAEFRQIVRSYRNRIEYREMRAALERAGVPVDSIFQLVSSALGWQNVDMATEAVILSV